MGLPRQEYWSGLPCPPPGDLPNPGIELRSPALQADSLPAKPQGKPKYTGVGSLSFLQGIFPTQESNRVLLHCRRILYQLSQKESPRILEWVAYPFSSGFSWPRSRSRVFCIAGRFFTNWTIREGPPWPETLINSRTTNIFKALDNNIYPPNYAFSYFSKEHLKMPFYRLCCDF